VGKFELGCSNVPLYRILRWLITHGKLTIVRKATKEELASYKTILSGLRPLEKYDQSLYPENGYKNNPFSQKLSVMVRDKTFIETLRALVYYSLGYFDVWFNDRGILQVTPLSKTDWEQTGLILTDGGYYGRKFKFSTTNAITNVIVNGSDFTAGTGVRSEDVIGLNLSAFFGNNTTSIADPNANNKNTSNAVKSTSSSKKTTSSSSKTMKNPFNNKTKKIIVSEDKGGTAGFKAGIIKKLKADGWTVKDLGTGPGTHSKSYDILSKSYAVNLTIYNGIDPKTIDEPVTGWLKGRHEKYGVQLVQMFDTHGWTSTTGVYNKKGMKPLRYGNLDGFKASKAWDDNYSGAKNGVLIKDLGAWYKKYYPKVIHCAGPSVSDAYKQFKAGGYLKSKGLVK
jgi:hypothetical protein